MDTLFIPTENDFKTWIREAVKESLSVSAAQNDKAAEIAQEPLISRKKAGTFLGISLVTLNEWMNERKGIYNNQRQGNIIYR